MNHVWLHEFSTWLWPRLAEHLGQATIFGALAWAAALALRRGDASARYGIWLMASAKFALPAGLLAGLWPVAPISLSTALPSAESVREAFPSAAPRPNEFLCVLTAVWVLGVAAFAVRSLIKAATPCGPAVRGIFRPRVLLPAGISDLLAPSELDAVLRHERAHIARLDTLTAALHRAVACLFWFHPLVWWIERRLVEERERACDAQVIASGVPREAYAAALLKLSCYGAGALEPGISRSNLKQRLEGIIHFSPTTGSARRLVMVALGAILLVPVMLSREVQKSNVKVEYDKNVPAKAKDLYEALARGESPKTDISEPELKRRQEYAAKRWGSLETDRARFYVALGPPEEIESRPSESHERWVYKGLRLQVEFIAP
jgi:beta-lactamase regulating signal transducer with metallopeptidase domain